MYAGVFSCSHQRRGLNVQGAAFLAWFATGLRRGSIISNASGGPLGAVSKRCVKKALHPRFPRESMATHSAVREQAARAAFWAARRAFRRSGVFAASKIASPSRNRSSGMELRARTPVGSSAARSAWLSMRVIKGSRVSGNQSGVSATPGRALRHSSAVFAPALVLVFTMREASVGKTTPGSRRDSATSRHTRCAAHAL